MRKRLSSKPAKPRAWIALPGYPTLAAAGLSLCLSGTGCSDPAGTIESPYQGDAARDALPNGTPAPAGFIAPPFQPDAGLAPDVLPPTSAADADEPDAGASSDGGPDSTAVAIDPSNMAGGEPYLFIPDAGDETNN